MMSSQSKLLPDSGQGPDSSVNLAVNPSIPLRFLFKLEYFTLDYIQSKFTFLNSDRHQIGEEIFRDREASSLQIR